MRLMRFAEGARLHLEEEASLEASASLGGPGSG